MHNLPETPIIFPVYSPKSYKMRLAYQKHQVHTVLTIKLTSLACRRGRMKWKVVTVRKAILIAISEINYIKHCTDQSYVHKHAYLGLD
jgi:hypothetical protein